VHLDAAGHPLHTRALSVGFFQRDDAKLDVRAAIIDLRKRGVVPVGGDIQGPGLIHHMQLAGIVDPVTATLETIAAAQPAVAFEASATSAGESCRDPIDAVRAVAGARLDDTFRRGISAAIGGPRGCSHVATLAHLLGSTGAWVIEREEAAHGRSAERPTGQRVFQRDVIVDGQEPAAGTIVLALQLTDLHFAPSAPLARPIERFAGELEFRARAEVDLAAGLRLVRITGAERRRGRADLASAAWRDRDDLLQPLVGIGLGPGVTGEFLARLGEAHADDRPLRDALLMLAPTLVQCAATLAEGWVVAAQRSSSIVGMGALPDSCYMWRRGGALWRVRQDENREASGQD
jgi:Protein of unknown function (DUF2889)